MNILALRIWCCVLLSNLYGECFLVKANIVTFLGQDIQDFTSLWILNENNRFLDDNPTVEQLAMPEAEPEAESEPEAEPEAESTPEEEAMMYEEMKSHKAHVIVFSVLFGVVCILSLLLLGLVFKSKGKWEFNLATVVLLLCFCVGFSRVLLLSVNAYDFGFPSNAFPRTLVFILWGAGYPLLTGAFALIVLNLYNLAWHLKRMRQYSGFLVKFRVFFFVNVAAEFVVQLVSDILISQGLAVYENFLVCQIYFCIWSVIIIVSANLFTFQIFDTTGVFGKFHRNSGPHSPTNTSSHVDDVQYSQSRKTYAKSIQRKTYRIIRLMTLSCLLLIAGALWGMIAYDDVMGNFDKFIVYETFMRSVEFFMVLTMLQMNTHYIHFSAKKAAVFHRNASTRANSSSMYMKKSDCESNSSIVRHRDSFFNTSCDNMMPSETIVQITDIELSDIARHHLNHDQEESDNGNVVSGNVSRYSITPILSPTHLAVAS